MAYSLSPCPGSGLSRRSSLCSSQGRSALWREVRAPHSLLVWHTRRVTAPCCAGTLLCQMSPSRCAKRSRGFEELTGAALRTTLQRQMRPGPRGRGAGEGLLKPSAMCLSWARLPAVTSARCHSGSPAKDQPTATARPLLQTAL